MWTWKLLGDLQPEELKLECERANLVSSDKAFHNCVKLAKYILGNGYDPETFYFNTHYKADKSSPLIGMSAAGQLGATSRPPSSREARTTPPAAVNLVTSANPAVKRNNSSDEVLESIFGYVKKMSSDIQQLLTKKKQEENIQQHPCTGSGLGEDCSYDGQTWSDDESSLPSLPFWDSLESVPSIVSSNGSSSRSFGSKLTTHRKYDKNLLIGRSICLAYQHGTCPFGEQADSHQNGEGRKVIHYCGLCETDSPDNQCYSPAYKCPGPYFNS